MIDETMTENELMALHDRISDRLGWFSMFIVSVSDVKEACEHELENGCWDEDGPSEIPTDEEIRMALRRVWKHYDGGSWIDCRDWAVEEAREYCLQRLKRSTQGGSR